LKHEVIREKGEEGRKGEKVIRKSAQYGKWD
jgi:hypothetical protein